MTKTQLNLIAILASYGINEKEATQYFEDVKSSTSSNVSFKQKGNYFYVTKSYKSSKVSPEYHQKSLASSSMRDITQKLFDNNHKHISINFSSCLSGKGNSGTFQVSATMNICVA